MSNYEGFRVRQSTNGLFTVATPEMRSGDFSFEQATTPIFDPTTKKIVNGVTTGSVFAGNFANIPRSKSVTQPGYPVLRHSGISEGAKN
jgi:DNA-binding cell septation regulator SpoVG